MEVAFCLAMSKNLLPNNKVALFIIADVAYFIFTQLFLFYFGLFIRTLEQGMWMEFFEDYDGQTAYIYKLLTGIQLGYYYYFCG